MLAPLRDHLRPKDPASSPLLNTTREIYFARLSGEIPPGKPGFEEARWITTEDVNVEHLLDVFTTIDANSECVWDTCNNFMAQLYWHKSRLVTLGQKIEALANDHPSKAECLFNLARLFDSVGSLVERKRLLSHCLELWREQGNDFKVARTLRRLSDADRRMGMGREGMWQAKEASEIFERLGNTVDQALSLIDLAWSLYQDGQLNAAEEAASRGIDLLPEHGEEFSVYEAHRILGHIYQSQGEMEKAIHHLEIALAVASSLNTAEELFWVNYSLADALSKQGKFEDAQTRLDHAKSHAANNTYLLAYAMDRQARVWEGQHRFEEARSEALRALDIFEKLGAAHDVEDTKGLLWSIDAQRAGRPS